MNTERDILARARELEADVVSRGLEAWDAVRELCLRLARAELRAERGQDAQNRPENAPEDSRQ